MAARQRRRAGRWRGDPIAAPRAPGRYSTRAGDRAPRISLYGCDDHDIIVAAGCL